MILQSLYLHLKLHGLLQDLQGEEEQSITAYSAAVAAMKLALNKQLFVKDLTLTGDPQPGNAGSGISVFGHSGCY